MISQVEAGGDAASGMEAVIGVDHLINETPAPAPTQEVAAAPEESAAPQAPARDESLDRLIAHLRDVNVDAVGQLITGDSIDDVLASVAVARQAFAEAVQRAQVMAPTAIPKVPAGAVPGSVSTELGKADERDLIKFGLTRR